MKFFNPKTTFPIVILFLIFLEGIGVNREFIYLLVVSLPLILGIITIYSKNGEMKLKVPYYLGWAVIFFLLSSIVSIILAPNIQRSFEYTIYWIVIFLTTIFFYNAHTQQMLKKIFYGLVALGFIFAIYAVFLKYLLPEAWSVLIPRHMHQYVADPFGTHNPLGVFLLIPLAMLLPSWRYGEMKNEQIAFILLFGFLVFSYTRAAYATFALISLFFIGFEVFIKKRKLPKRIYVILGSFIIVCIFLSIIIAWFSSGPEWYLRIHDFFVDLFGMPRYKGFISGRIHFGLQAIKGLIERPWIGWGSDNLFYASIKYTPITKFTTYVSENLILDIFSEQGIIGGILFFWMIGCMFWRSFVLVKQSDSILNERFFFAFTTLLILMMGNTIKRNYMLFMFFFIIAALLYSERRNMKIHFNTLFITSIILFIFVFLKINSTFFLAINKPQFAQFLYPLNKNAYPILIDSSQNRADSKSQQRWTDQYLFLFPGDPQTLISAGNTYMDINKQQALDYYMRAYEASPLNDFTVVEGIYFLKKDIEGKQMAKEFLFAHINRYLFAKKWAAGQQQKYASLEGNIMFLCGEEGYDCWFVYDEVEKIN
ncbi:hypothetical protein COY16_06180 [Candidatus Roizmanbacteria bacterium CG_4_10_14_0_2_um_filter_39_13]|uniref:O-antigen ligase-related domain-containing protein n=1 Tax=Candidatus Roizmanbacteria bacterium CG_4_10_14_0_2_um_filter_39_13 TaxID=1974825 RepID=A0A2M7TV10_9BACT|nr:MAG: hypothetical protein COY16_06180 [Candidatus Roizmanbacteria bacterium CG_4_10_14_0_2_um_filter_39_13]